MIIEAIGSRITKSPPINRPIIPKVEPIELNESVKWWNASAFKEEEVMADRLFKIY